MWDNVGIRSLWWWDFGCWFTSSRVQEIIKVQKSRDWDSPKHLNIIIVEPLCTSCENDSKPCCCSTVFKEIYEMFKTAPPKSLQICPAQKQGSAIIGQWPSTSEMYPKFPKSYHVDVVGTHRCCLWLICWVAILVFVLLCIRYLLYTYMPTTHNLFWFINPYTCTPNCIDLRDTNFTKKHFTCLFNLLFWIFYTPSWMVQPC